MTTNREHVTINNNTTVHLAAYGYDRHAMRVITGRDCDSAPAHSRGARITAHITTAPLTCKSCIRYAAKLTRLDG